MSQLPNRPANQGGLIGPLVATITLVVLGFVAPGFYASDGGLLLAGTFAFMTGTGAAARVDTRRGRSGGIVAGYIVALLVVYRFILPAVLGPFEPGSPGGPATSVPR